ncbi:hypothetical protein JNUCC1_02087 [Lentibacillus sp. JNUCC-1]|uniref:hypothetical protein n=1 Tax=Lentibacillus sp. JNUCC-1 TaxID=2654513 RepID=UPI0012E7E5BB|nr:hypothetical protein [Lentibacillus sp. JNUCC-1]MUV38251.1 hypothetical protein [Lentibacillus sp. JNUCC-1]
MANKDFDELLEDVKQDYKNMPESIDQQSIMAKVFLGKKHNRWKKFAPTAAALAGLAIFMIMVFSVTDSEQPADDEQEKAPVNYKRIFWIEKQHSNNLWVWRMWMTFQE